MCCAVRFHSHYGARNRLRIHCVWRHLLHPPSHLTSSHHITRHQHCVSIEMDGWRCLRVHCLRARLHLRDTPSHHHITSSHYIITSRHVPQHSQVHHHTKSHHITSHTSHHIITSQLHI